jgi:hypothetical protein
MAAEGSAEDWSTNREFPKENLIYERGDRLPPARLVDQSHRFGVQRLAVLWRRHADTPIRFSPGA